MTIELVSLAVQRPSASYGATLAPAHAFVADAADHLRQMARALDGRLTERIDDAATTVQLARDLAEVGARLAAAEVGLLVLAFAGHGGRVLDHSADELDGIDEAWALDDRPLSDDALSELLRGVPDHVHVVVISNCCYSGGMLDPDDDERAARASADGDPPQGTNRVLIASCRAHQGTLLTNESRLTKHLLDTVFPADDRGRRVRELDYLQLDTTLGLLASVAQTPLVLAAPADKRRRAFRPQPLVELR